MAISALAGYLGSSFGQAPNLFSYQAVIRDANGALITNANIGIELKIRQGSTSGAVVYSETQTLISNPNGLVTAQIGAGSVVSGNINNIDWSKGPYFLENNTDPEGGTNYTIKGTIQLLSVPYALYAAKSGNVPTLQVYAGKGMRKSGDTLHAETETDIWNAGKIRGNTISGITPSKDDVLQWNGSEWKPAKINTGSGNSSIIAGAGLLKNGDTLHAKNTQSIWSAADLQGRSISTSAPANNDVLKWNGSSWAPAAIATGGGSSNPIVAGMGLSKSGDTINAKTGNALWNAAFIQNRSISAVSPVKDDVLQYNGSIWVPATIKGVNVFAGNGLFKTGDTINASNNNAIWNANLLQGRNVSTLTPSVNDVLKWTGSSWSPGAASGGGSNISCGTTFNANYTVRGTGSGGWECTDAVWINSMGNVGIGTTSPSTSFNLTVGTNGLLVNGSSTTSNFLGRIRIGSSSSTSYELQVDGDGYMTGSLRVGTTLTPATGGIMANGVIETNARFSMNSSTTGTGTAVVRTSSGELRPQSSTIHVKDNVKNLAFSKEKLFALRPVSYNLKPALGGEHEIGLIAEEVADYMPELVIYGPERKWKGNTGIPETDATGKEIVNPNHMVPYSVHYDRLPVYLLSIIKEQDARIKNLEERLEKLERR